MPDYVRLMRREDIDQVSKIDREAFATEWPPPNFKRELDNRLAHYIVACNASELVEEAGETDPAERGLTRLLSVVRRLFGQDRLPDNRRSARGNECITGFAGFWVMADEAHITSIATREAFRRRGIGELLLQSIIDQATRLKARIITLEVRVSNTVAQALYTKYGFSQVGVRRAYYSDNLEDAIVMSTDHIASPSYQAHLKELKKAYATKWGQARYQLGS